MICTAARWPLDQRSWELGAPGEGPTPWMEPQPVVLVDMGLVDMRVCASDSDAPRCAGAILYTAVCIDWLCAAVVDQRWTGADTTDVSTGSAEQLNKHHLYCICSQSSVGNAVGYVSTPVPTAVLVTCQHLSPAAVGTALLTVVRLPVPLAYSTAVHQLYLSLSALAHRLSKTASAAGLRRTREFTVVGVIGRRENAHLRQREGERDRELLRYHDNARRGSWGSAADWISRRRTARVPVGFAHR